MRILGRPGAGERQAASPSRSEAQPLSRNRRIRETAADAMFPREGGWVRSNRSAGIRGHRVKDVGSGRGATQNAEQSPKHPTKSGL